MNGFNKLREEIDPNGTLLETEVMALAIVMIRNGKRSQGKLARIAALLDVNTGSDVDDERGMVDAIESFRTTIRVLATLVR